MGGGLRQQRADAGTAGRGRWPAVAVGLVATFMTLLDVSIVNVAVPSIDRAMRLSSGELQWILVGYALTFGLVLVPAGRFGDVWGRRLIFVTGIALFTLTSAAAGLAGSPAWLVAARLLQGFAAGMVTPQVSGVIQELFQPPDRGRPFGLLGATVGVSTAIGPLLGGSLIALGGPEHGWRLVFFVNVPVGIAAAVLGLRVFPGRRADASEDRLLDPVGVLLLGFGVVLVLLPLVQERQWSGSVKWLLLPAAALVLAGFVWWENRYARRARPVFNLLLLRIRSYRLGALIALVYFAGFTAVFFVFTLYLQAGLGYSALLAGLAITPFALGSAASAALGGRIVNRYGRKLVAVGLLLTATGLVAVVATLSVAPEGDVPLHLAAPLLVAGVGSGLTITPNPTLTLTEVPVDDAGSAAGMLQTGQRIGSAVGIAAVGAAFFSTLATSGGDWARAFRYAILIAAGFVLVALAAAVTDVVAERRGSAQSAHPPASRRP
ncbi:MAG TPA: MFS transporter [Micromonosporaceae bacterium]|nr:MFS transporter [Micromonosporaceae bacterium]